MEEGADIESLLGAASFEICARYDISTAFFEIRASERMNKCQKSRAVPHTYDEKV